MSMEIFFKKMQNWSCRMKAEQLQEKLIDDAYYATILHNIFKNNQSIWSDFQFCS